MSNSLRCVIDANIGVVSSPLLGLDQRLVNALATAPYNVCLFTDFSIPPL